MLNGRRRAAYPRAPYPMPTTAAESMAREARHDDVEDCDDAVDNGCEDRADAVDNRHEAVADGAENAFDLSDC